MIQKDHSALSKNKQLIENIQNNIPWLRGKFERLKSLITLPLSHDNFNEAINCFYSIFDSVPLMATHLDSLDVPMFRARPNGEKNKLYTKQSEISYNSNNTKAIGEGRFNRPLESVFYASLPVTGSEISSSLVACLETCKGLTNTEYPVLYKDFTISRWKIKEPFYVVNLCFDEAHLSANKSLKAATDKFIDGIRSAFNADAADFIVDFLTYFSQMSGRKSPKKNEYYILNALSYAVKYYYKEKSNMDVYGFVYPSAMTEAKGLNVVLSTAAVDKYLLPDMVAMYRFILNGKTYSAVPCSAAVPIVEGKFEIANFQPVPIKQSYTLDCETEEGPLRESAEWS